MGLFYAVADTDPVMASDPTLKQGQVKKNKFSKTLQQDFE
jgi:hypothetical protein